MEAQLSTAEEVTMLATKQADMGVADQLTDLESKLLAIEDHLFGGRSEKEIAEGPVEAPSGQLQQMFELSNGNSNRLVSIIDRINRISNRLGVSS